MTQCSRNELLVGLVKDEKLKKAARKKTLEDYNVAGCVHPLRPQMTTRTKVHAGNTIAFAVKEACKLEGVREAFAESRGIAQIGKRDFEKGITVWEPVSKKDWDKRKLKEGELLRFRLLPAGGGGGGGGKSPLRTILTVVVAVVALAAAVMVPELAVFAGAKWFGLSASATSTLIGGIAGLAVSTIGMVLVNAIAPVKPPSVGGLSKSNNSAESKVYGISAGRNAINQWGRVPAPLGRGRFAAPKAASPYTQTVGDDAYLHELLCLGIGDMDFSQYKIGNTNIEEFQDCEYEIFRYDPDSPKASKLYPSGVFQEDLSIDLKYGKRNTRTTAECDHFEIDFAYNGLAYYNDDSSKSTVSVSHKVEYRKKNENVWKTVASPVFVGSKSLTVDPRKNDFQPNLLIVASKNKGIQFLWNTSEVPADAFQLAKILFSKVGLFLEARTIEGSKIPLEFETSGFSVSHTARAGFLSEDVIYVNVSGGYISDVDINNPTSALEVTHSGAQARLLRKTLSVYPKERGVYEVAITRITHDSENDRLVNASNWTALRSVSNDNPVNTDYPVWLMAIRIRASGQLSGAIDTLTHFYETKILDWDNPTETWVHRYSSNPASIYRHILQDSIAMARPQADEILDLPSIQEAHEFWAEKNWEYNLVCDSSVGVFDRLQSVCAAGLASPTMVDGKWAIIIDKPREHVACAFTSANSWGWSFKRTQVRLPQDIHCTFISEKTWDTDMRKVATDEPRTGQYLYESQTYEGVNKPEQIYQLARFHYGDAKVRRRLISFRCYDESLLCTRGDLVDCAAPNISPHGLQVGRVRKIAKDEDDNVVALYTDQLNATDFSGRRFGVKVYAQNGAILHAEVLAEDKSQRKLTLKFAQPMDVHVGDKYAFGDYSEEVFKAVVLGMKFNPDWTCDVTLQDYAPQLYGRLDEPIPDFQSIITTPITGKWIISSVPHLETPVTDERALLQTKSGTVPRIYVQYSHPVDLDDRAVGVAFEISPAGQNNWTLVQRNYPLQNTEFYFDGVTESENYDIRVRYIGAVGEVGNYAYVRNIKIIGRTTPPPPPSSVFINGTTLLIQQKIRPLDVVGHKVYMAMDEGDDFNASIELTNPYTVTGTFDLKPWAGKARAIFVKTVDEIGLLSTPVRIVVDLGDVASRNVLFEISEKERSWSGDISGGYVSGGTLFSEDSVTRYPQDDITNYYEQFDSSAYYPSGVSATLIYTWRVEITKGMANSRILVLPEIASGKTVSLLFRHWAEVARYGEDTTPYYPQDVNLPMYPQMEISEWAVMPEEYFTPGSEILEMRITYSPTEQAQIMDIKTVIDVEDVDITFQDVVVSSSGDTRITLPSKRYHAITSVIPGIQFEEGDDVLAVKYIKGSETLDEDGYVVLGPIIRAFNASGALTSANCDFRVKGY